MPADLSTKIAQALEQPPSDLDALKALIAETDAALKALEHEIVTHGRQLIDPARSESEAVALHATIESETLRARRLQAGSDRLRAALEEGTRQRREAERAEHRRQVLEERDATAQALTEHYPRLAQELSDLLHRTAESEAACARINLPGPESLARNLSGHDVHRLTTGVILPDFTLSEHKVGRGFWPPVRRAAPGVTTNMSRRSAELGNEIRAIGAEVTAQRSKASVFVAPATPTSAAQEVA